MNDFIKTKELAVILNVSEQTIIYRVRVELLPRPDHIIGKSFLWEKDTIVDYLKDEIESIDKRIHQLKSGDSFGA